VLDLSTRLAGAYCARLFGDFGADVRMLETDRGHPLRQEPPFLGEEAGPERSLLHSYVNANKTSWLDDGEDTLTEQIAGADVIVTTEAPWPQRLRGALKSARTDAIVLSVTPFGLEGPLAGAEANNLTLSAMSGWSSICGYEGEPPLTLARHTSEFLAGVASFVGGAAALLRRQSTGQGTLVDVSELEAMIVSSAPWSLALIFDPGGYTEAVHRHDRERAPFLRVADGEISVVLGQGPFWRDAMTVLGLAELAELADAGFDEPEQRRQLLSAAMDRIEEAVARRPRMELFELLSQVRGVAGVVQSTSDLLDNPQLRARDYFVGTTVDGQRVERPGAQVKLSATPWALKQDAPRLSEHQKSSETAEWGRRARPAAWRGAAVPSESPLAGVRVLTFTQAWSGPLGTELLALLGADVVQVEARRRPDVWRMYVSGYNTAVPPRIADPSRRQRGWNTMGLYNATNLNKRAITLDMHDPRGAKIFWRLLPKFDVFAESFSPHVLPNWGVTYETLQDARPDIIFASLSGYGATGPYTNYPANGATIEPMSGLSSLNGYEGDQAGNTGGLIPDPIGGMYLASSIVAALHHRARTGEGQRIDLSMMEVMASHLGDAVMEWSANGVLRRPDGNRHPCIAPHAVYATGDGQWLALSAEDDADFRALAELIGMPDLAVDPRFATVDARKANEAALDDLIGAWCAKQDADAATSALLAAGCASARVSTLPEVLLSPNPQVVSRGFVTEQEHPEAGLHPIAVAPWKFDGRPTPLRRPSPCMGEHSFEIFQQELGMELAEYEELVAAGVTGDEPPD
jgi:crotonobetainyl-CoA:carnitine CoA-transferase CaiB-like acyl-CoA transferase